MQVYSVAIPAGILGGIALLGVVVTSIADNWIEAVRAAWTQLPGL